MKARSDMVFSQGRWHRRDPLAGYSPAMLCALIAAQGSALCLIQGRWRRMANGSGDSFAPPTIQALVARRMLEQSAPDLALITRAGKRLANQARHYATPTNLPKGNAA